MCNNTELRLMVLGMIRIRNNILVVFPYAFFLLQVSEVCSSVPSEASLSNRLKAIQSLKRLKKVLPVHQ